MAKRAADGERSPLPELHQLPSEGEVHVAKRHGGNSNSGNSADFKAPRSPVPPTPGAPRKRVELPTINARRNVGANDVFLPQVGNGGRKSLGVKKKIGAASKAKVSALQFIDGEAHCSDDSDDEADEEESGCDSFINDDPESSGHSDDDSLPDYCKNKYYNYL